MTFQHMARGMRAAALAAALWVSGAARAEEFRAWWVDYANAGMRTQTEITTLISDVKKARMNAVVAQVRPRGDAFYISGYEPRSEYLTAAHLADPLRALLNAAHASVPRIEVHAWINAEKQWSKPVEDLNNAADPDWPDSPYHPFRLFPEFRNADDTGALYAEGDGYFFDPGHPRQLDYNVKVVEDLARRYPDLDGIHYDFVRYATLDWGFTPTALARFSAQSGMVPAKTGNQWTTPASDFSVGLEPNFAQWRRDQVTGFVREAYARVYRVNPNIKISGALTTISGPPSAVTDSAWYGVDPFRYRYQDWYAWMKEGVLDIGMGMVYKSAATDEASFEGWARFLAGADDAGFSHGVVGEGIYLNSAAESIAQLKYARSGGGKGFVGFSYADQGNGSTTKTQFINALTVNNADNGNDAPYKTNVAALSAPWKHANGLLEGRLTDALTGAPPIPATNPGGPSSYPTLNGVSVRITAGPAGTVGRVVSPNSMGTFVFVNLPPGAYTVAASVPSTLAYAAASVSATVRAGEAASVALALSPRAEAGVSPTNAAVVEVDDRARTVAAPDNSVYAETGTWSQGTSTTLGYQGTYRSTASNSNATARWQPYVPVAGRYRVYARWAAGSNRGSDVRYTVDTGTDTGTHTVSQRIDGGQWNLLGTYYFHQGRSGRITVSATSTGFVIADAVRLERETPELWPITTYTVPQGRLSAPVSDDTAAYFGSADGHLYAYNMAEDRPMWRFPTGDQPTGNDASLRPAVSNGTVYYAENSATTGRLRALRSTATFPQLPQVVWTSASLPARVTGSPSVLDGVLYVGAADGRVYGLNAGSASVSGVGPGGVLFQSPPLGAAVAGAPAVLPGSGVWVQLQDGRVVNLAADLRAVRWMTGGTAATSASVYTDGRRVFAASADGSVLALNAANGQPAWNAPASVGAPAGTPMGDGAGRLYVVTAANRLWALNAEDGSVVPGYAGGVALPATAQPGTPLVVPRENQTPVLYIPGDSRLTFVDGAQARQHDLGRAMGTHGPGMVHAPAVCGPYIVATSDNGQLLGWKTP